MEKLLVAAILKICAGDTSVYYVQGYEQDCHHYYINCAIGLGGEIDLERCQDDKHKAKQNSDVSK